MSHKVFELWGLHSSASVFVKGPERKRYLVTKKWLPVDQESIQ